MVGAKVLSVKPVVLAISVNRIANDRVSCSREMPANLVHSPGQGMGKDQAIATRGVAFSWPGKLRSANGAENRLSLSSVLERTIDAERRGHETPSNG